ncbi:MAG: BTAD domain-containing putative transcriptional regulator [Caldimonas sp.]
MFGLFLLGPVLLQRDGAPLALPVRKSLALLVLLARSGGALPRARAAALLWPALEETLGRRNLRRELARLRDAGAADVVRSDGDKLALADGVACDVDAFDASLREGRPEQALALCRGPLAEGLALGEADGFDDWLATERDRLRLKRRQTLRDAAAASEARGDVDAALAHVRTLLDEDALEETHHRDAMRLLAACGRREAALAQYETCRALLRDELGLAPMAETEALAAALRGVHAMPPAADAGTPASNTATVRLAPVAVRLPAVLPFVGRADETARLEDAWQAGRTVVVEGEGGVGKTRLCTDFATAHGPYALVRCRAGDAELPYSAFTRALRVLMGPTPALEAVPEWVVSEVARLVPELGAAPDAIRSEEERARFVEACAQAWQGLADDSFDAIVLDDWHFADAASVALLTSVAQRRHEAGAARGGAREWLLVRPELAASAREALRGLIAATEAVHLVLKPLPGSAVLELVERLSGASRPVRFAARLERATGGNAFFLAETLRHLMETRLLVADAAGDWHTPYDDATEDYRELSMPASVVDAVLARVRRLSVSSQRLLEAAAIATEPFEPGLLAPACALTELDAVFAIEEAVAASLLHERDEGGFSFAHDLVRQALADSLSAERRRLVHRRLALAAEQARAPAAVIAAHHEASGDTRRAVRHRLVAGDEAERLHALGEAIAQWTRALDDGTSAGEELVLRERLSRAASQRAQLDLVEQQAERLRELIDGDQLSPEERTQATLARAFALIFAGRCDLVLPELDARPEPEDPALRARYRRVRCMTLKELGRIDEALAAARDALAMPQLLDADRIELLDIAFVCEHDAGHVASALEFAGAALALSRRTSNRHGIARSRYRRGLQLLQMDDVDAAIAELRAAVDDCERFGFVRTERAALYNLSNAYAAQSLPARALEAAHRAWNLQPPMQPGPLTAMLRLAIAESLHALGDLGEAWRLGQLSVEEALAQNEPTVRILVLAGVAESFAILGELGRARALFDSLDAAVLRQLTNAASSMWVALGRAELHDRRPAAAALALDRLDAAGGLVEEQVRVRYGQARAAIALAEGDADAALALVPADNASGSNAELRARGLALRVRAEAARGALGDATQRAVAATLVALPEHALAVLDLRAALASAAREGVAGVPLEATAEHAACVERLASTLRDHPAQEAAFRRGQA